MLTENTYPGHEKSGAGLIRPILYGAILFVVALVLVLVASGVIGGGQDVTPPSAASLKAPALQVDPVTDMKAMDAREAQLLNSYGWVDKGAGIVRIPIERAIELTAEQGLR
jgi:hypothetical protein